MLSVVMLIKEFDRGRSSCLSEHLLGIWKFVSEWLTENMTAARGHKNARRGLENARQASETVFCNTKKCPPRPSMYIFGD